MLEAVLGDRRLDALPIRVKGRKAWQLTGEVDGAGGYGATSSSNPDGGKTWVDAPPTLQAKMTIGGLPAGVTVLFRYRAVTKTGADDWSAPITFAVK